MADQVTKLPIEAKRGSLVSQDPVPVLDSAKFDHMQRIASAMSQSSLVPKHLIGKDDRETIANCFRVVNQAVRWGFDPFSVVDETYVVGGKIAYQGKLIAAVVNAKSNLKERLAYEYNDKQGDALEVTVIGQFQGEEKVRTVKVRVGDAKTQNQMWTKDPRQKLIYTGAIKWARAYCPELMLGVMTDDDLERITVDITPTPRPTRADPLPEPQEQQAEPQQAPEPQAGFTLVDSHGQVWEYSDAPEARGKFEDLLAEAEKAEGRPGFEGLWESNTGLLGALRDAGHPDIADQLHALYAARQEAWKAAKKPEQKSAQRQTLDGPASAGASATVSVAIAPSTGASPPQPAEGALPLGGGGGGGLDDEEQARAQRIAAAAKKAGPKPTAPKAKDPDAVWGPTIVWLKKVCAALTPTDRAYYVGIDSPEIAELQATAFWKGFDEWLQALPK